MTDRERIAIVAESLRRTAGDDNNREYDAREALAALEAAGCAWFGEKGSSRLSCRVPFWMLWRGVSSHD